MSRSARERLVNDTNNSSNNHRNNVDAVVDTLNGQIVSGGVPDNDSSQNGASDDLGRSNNSSSRNCNSTSRNRQGDSPDSGNDNVEPCHHDNDCVSMQNSATSEDDRHDEQQQQQQQEQEQQQQRLLLLTSGLVPTIYSDSAATATATRTTAATATTSTAAGNRPHEQPLGLLLPSDEKHSLLHLPLQTGGGALIDCKNTLYSHSVVIDCQAASVPPLQGSMPLPDNGSDTAAVSDDGLRNRGSTDLECDPPNDNVTGNHGLEQSDRVDLAVTGSTTMTTPEFYKQMWHAVQNVTTAAVFGAAAAAAVVSIAMSLVIPSDIKPPEAEDNDDDEEGIELPLMSYLEQDLILQAVACTSTDGRAPLIPLPIQVARGETTSLLDNNTSMHESNAISASTPSRMEPWWQTQWLVCRLTTFLVAALLVAVLLVAGPFQDRFTRSTTSGMSREARHRQTEILRYINNITLSGRKLVLVDAHVGIGTTRASTEETALRWLIREDPLHLTPNTTPDALRLRQRYALATLWAQQADGATVNGEIGLDECTWPGVSCNATTDGNEVTAIYITRFGFKGRLASDLGLLSALLRFEAAYNLLIGTLPPAFEHWTRLNHFDASFNSLTGSLPSSIASWTDLIYFDVSVNAFHGSWPISTRKWTNLEYIGAWNNSFTGTVRVGQHWTKLMHYNLWGRASRGTLREKVNHLTSIAEYIANVTMSDGASISIFCGDVKHPTVECRALQWLLANDMLKDVVPSTSLRRFKLRQRYALATLWAQQGIHNVAISSYGRDECGWNWVTCKLMDLGNDRGTALAVTEIDLVEDRPGTTTKWRLTNDLGLLSSLVRFHATITGSLPTSIGNWTNLEYFFSYASSLTGILPSTIGQWTALKRFSAQSSKLTGSLPASIGKWSKLEFFSIRENSITGELPSAVEKWTNVYYVDLSRNMGLYGSLPSSIGQWRYLYYFSAYETGFTGSIPTSIANWTYLQYLFVRAINLGGAIPTALCTVSKARHFSVYCENVTCACGSTECKCNGLGVWSRGG